MKVLAVCQAGTVRSGALALEAKFAGHDALQAGVQFNAGPTFLMLTEWADAILLAEPWMAAHIPKEGQLKLLNANLGPDHWHNPLNDELRMLCRHVIEGL